MFSRGTRDFWVLLTRKKKKRFLQHLAGPLGCCLVPPTNHSALAETRNSHRHRRLLEKAAQCQAAEERLLRNRRRGTTHFPRLFYECGRSLAVEKGGRAPFSRMSPLVPWMPQARRRSGAPGTKAPIAKTGPLSLGGAHYAHPLAPLLDAGPVAGEKVSTKDGVPFRLCCGSIPFLRLHRRAAS